MPFLPRRWKKSLPTRLSAEVKGCKVPPFRLLLEELDPREMPAVITVTSAADNTTLDGLVTLREAIIAANADADGGDVVATGTYGADVIKFNIGASGSQQTITLLANLPALTDNAGVLIDGYSQPGASMNTLAVGTDAVLLIEINGNTTAATIGLSITSANNTVQGLVINRVSGNGIDISGAGASANLIQGNYIGTDVNGTTSLGNAGDGVLITNSATGNTIGGTATGAGNLISGNGSDGVEISGSSPTGNVVLGNFIGTDATGTADLGNADSGIFIDSANNTVGGTAAGARNVISGNSTGITIDSTSNNMVLGNYIGTDVTGTAPLGNDFEGIAIFDSTDNTIGGTTADARNIISSNGDGISINSDFGPASGNVVLGNYIGTDVTGTAPLGNVHAGVNIIFASDNTIGGTAAGAGNLISDNDDGISLLAASGTLIAGNFIGTDASGTADLGNFTAGIILVDAVDNTIGGVTAGARNLISGNFGGIAITGANTGSTGNVVLGNFIGTDVTGTVALGNDNDGIAIADSSANTIGGTTAGSGNVISGNGMSCGCGSGNGVFLLEADSNVILGNFIGTDVTGTIALGNMNSGVSIIGSSDNTIGGTAAGARNIISGNADGVEIDRDFAISTGNVIQGNYIGTDVNGTAALGNSLAGIFIGDSANNTIGGTTAAARNVISGNAMGGIEILGSDSTGNAVLGNFIGTNAGGTAAIGNGNHGVFMHSGAASNTIGGTVAGAGNIIAFNAGAGVAIGDSPTDTTTVANQVLGNSIRGNGGIGIDLGSDGVTLNTTMPPAFPNNGAKRPSVISATNTGTITTVSGNLRSTPNTTFRLEFFSNPGGGNQGRTFLGFLNVTTNASGTVSYQFQTPQLPLSSTVTATATDDDTSEFSAPVTVTLPPPVVPPVQGGRITGTVFEDRNGNGIRNAGESGLGGVTVFADANGNGQFDPSEVQAVTAADGTYLLAITVGGTYSVRQFVPGGFRQSTANPAPVMGAAGQTVNGGDFGNQRRGLVAIGAGDGGGGLVRVLNGLTGVTIGYIAAYSGFGGSITVATGDVTGDGFEDIITGSGPGSTGHVKVFDGRTFAEVQSFLAYQGFLGGVSVAAGDVTGDGRADIITGAGPGAGPHVKVFDGATGALIRSFLAFGAFGGGVRVAAGDFNGDRLADILVSAGPGGGTHVKVFDGQTLAEGASFFAYPGFPGGVNVAAGDLDRDGIAEIITGAEGVAGPHVKVFSAAGALRASFLAFGGAGTGGVRVGFSDSTRTGATGLLLGAGPGSGSRVSILDGVTLAPIDDFFAFTLNTNGVFVG